jgi:hypothetical protein
MESSSPSPLVADYWVHISKQYNSSSKMPDDELHRFIVDTMLMYCFHCEDNKPYMREKLLDAMPHFHAHIRNTTLKRKIKVVKEIAACVKCEIGQRYYRVLSSTMVSKLLYVVRRYDERNLVFHAALIILFSMELDR